MPVSNLDSRYSIEIFNESGLSLTEFSGIAKNRNMRFVRNGTYEASFSLDLDTLEKRAREISLNPYTMLLAGRNEVVIKRLEVPLFGGKIAYHTGKIGDSKQVDVKVLGWLDLLKDRKTGPSDIVGPDDTAQILWDLIQTSQAKTYGNFGITQGQLQTSVSRGPILFEDIQIKEILQNFAERENGIDFEFTWDKVFNVYYPQMGVQRDEFEFIYPGNIKEFSVSTDATKLANYITVRGQGLGEGQIVDIVQDTDSQEQYGLREGLNDYSDIPDITFLQDLGNADLESSKIPVEIVDIVLDGNQQPYIGSYWLGDRIRIRINDIQMYSHIDAYYRIDEINVNIDDEDNEVITLKTTRV